MSKDSSESDLPTNRLEKRKIREMSFDPLGVVSTLMR